MSQHFPRWVTTPAGASLIVPDAQAYAVHMGKPWVDPDAPVAHAPSPGLAAMLEKARAENERLKVAKKAPRPPEEPPAVRVPIPVKPKPLPSFLVAMTDDQAEYLEEAVAVPEGDAGTEGR
jgi:hypothetical protein